MSTSGTVGQTVVSVQDLIDHGARRAGKLAEELTNEQVNAAKTSLYYLLSSLTNWGINYWAINKLVIGLIPDQTYYYLPVGTVDVLNANYRTTTNITQGYYSTSGVAANAFDGVGQSVCQLTTNTGAIGISGGSGNPLYINTVGILSAVTGSVTIEIQASADGITWNNVYSPGTVNWVSGQWLYYDLPETETVPYWRIQQVSGIDMGVYQVQFGTLPVAIPMARMNRDDYSNLPNRQFQNERPLQYWFNRTIPQPNMEVWPVPNSIQPQIELWLNRYIQDVGDLNGQIEIPQYMYLAIQWGLSHQMACELPQVDPGRITYCEQQYEKHLLMAQNENRDKSPIYFAPNISPYTR
jgi:hypothetical protein